MTVPAPRPSPLPPAGVSWHMAILIHPGWECQQDILTCPGSGWAMIIVQDLFLSYQDMPGSISKPVKGIDLPWQLPPETG